jgi:hypothetical protein
MNRLEVIYLSWLIIVIAGCQSQPQEIGATTTTEVTPKQLPTKTPIVTPASTLSPPSPTPTHEDIHTTAPTPLFPPFPTTTPGPTPTALVLTPDSNQPECETFSGGSRVETGQTVMNDPQFCITWLDTEDNETGFRIILEYMVEFPNRGETFVYEVGPDVTQVIVPEEHSPFPDESSEWCVRRNDFRITVIALKPGLERTVDTTGITLDCIPSDGIEPESP